MKQILIDLEQHNIRWARQMRAHNVSQIKWLWAQTILFGAVGSWFLLIPFFGGSWWYLATALIYGGMILFFWRWAYPRHVTGIWKAARQEAEARKRLKELDRL